MCPHFPTFPAPQKKEFPIIICLPQYFQIQFTDADSSSYCDKSLFMFAFLLLSLGWVVLVGALVVFLVDRILTKIVCCRLCRNVTTAVTVRAAARDKGDDAESETVHLNKSTDLMAVDV